ncbi:MAG TPA: hypothetical protein VF458_12990, partial [Ktedonobacteraceae bacterium]
MSSTQMDLSPIVTNRKQDIASWPEGDIDQLTARDKNRYHKRRAAIIDYFQSDLAVAEISYRHRLSGIDSLEAMARRCCVLHEDGQPWGFRALVPGARVIESSAAIAAGYGEEQASDEVSDLARVAGVEVARVELADQSEVEEVEAIDANEDTAEHEAIHLKKSAALPLTPIPTSAQEQAALALMQAEAQLTAEPEDVETMAATSGSEDGPEVLSPTPGSLVEISVDEEVIQEAFSAAGQVVIEAEMEEGVEQGDFPTTVKTIEETSVQESAREAVEQEEFPVTASVVEEVEVEQEKQEGFPTVVSAVEEAEVEEEEVEQEDFPVVASAVEEVVEEEEVEQEDFPTLLNAVATGEESDLVSEDEELGNEPTGKLSELRSVEQSERDEQVEEEEGQIGVELLQTTKLETVQSSEEEGEKKEEQEVRVRAEGEEEAVEVQARGESEEESAELEVANLDTVEVAQVKVEEHLNRVAATETIKVPAAILEALEQADQDLQARTETLVEPETTSEKTDASAEDHPVAALPAVVEAEETQVSQGADDVTAVPTRTLEFWRRDDRQLSQAPVWTSPTQSPGQESRYQITGSQAALKHAVLRRWGKQGRRQKQRRWVRIISAAIVVSLLVILLIPLGVGLVGYNAYTNIKSVANDGVSNLLALQTILPKDKNDLISALNAQKLADGKAHLQKAQDDFLQLQDLVNRPDIQSLLQQFAPQYSNQLEMARHLVQVALDVTRMGQELIGVGQTAAGVLHGGSSLLASANTPLVSADEIGAIQAALVHAEYYIGDIQAQMSQVNLAQLPFGKASDKAKLGTYLNQIPQALDTINQVQTLIGPVAWMLGVGTARHFLVQTLDRGELRPSGGFEGQYGVLTLQDGRMSPFSLTDIAKLD